MPNEMIENREAVAAIFQLAAKMTAAPLVFVHDDEDDRQPETTGDHE